MTTHFILARKVGVGQHLITVWPKDSKDETIIRRVVTKDNQEAFIGEVKSTYGIEPDLSYLWRIVPDIMSYNIPGINQKVDHPVTGAKMDLMNCIMDLNDSVQWTREQIADWLETLDNQPVFNNDQQLILSSQEEVCLPLINNSDIQQAEW